MSLDSYPAKGRSPVENFFLGFRLGLGDPSRNHETTHNELSPMDVLSEKTASPSSSNPDRANQDPAQQLHEWIEAHSDYLLNYSKKYLGNKEASEDIVQETFLAAAEGIERFQGRSAPRTWLVGILRHKLMDHIRKQGREISTDSETLELEQTSHLYDEAEHWHANSGPLSWKTSPEAILRNQQFLDVLQQCLGKLPKRLRQIFLLREMDELSRDEIALELELKNNHVGVLLFRARAELQNCLHINWLQRSAQENT